MDTTLLSHTLGSLFHVETEQDAVTYAQFALFDPLMTIITDVLFPYLTLKSFSEKTLTEYSDDRKVESRLDIILAGRDERFAEAAWEILLVYEPKLPGRRNGSSQQLMEP